MKKSSKAKVIRLLIRKGKYDWNAAIEHTADRIVEYPQALLWR